MKLTKTRICKALLFNAWFLHGRFCLLIIQRLCCLKRFWHFCLANQISMISNYKIRPVVPFHLYVSDHVPPAGFVWSTLPHAKSDTSWKSSLFIIGGWIEFSMRLLKGSTILSHLLYHLIWGDKNQSLLYKFLKLWFYHFLVLCNTREHI